VGGFLLSRKAVPAHIVVGFYGNPKMLRKNSYAKIYCGLASLSEVQCQTAVQNFGRENE
jgi:hypothetical protein